MSKSKNHNMLFCMDNIVKLPHEDLDKWCERYELDPFVTKCINCGRDIHVNIPFAQDSFRGLTSEFCECGCHGHHGDRYCGPPSCYVSVDQSHPLNQLKSEFNDIN